MRKIWCGGKLIYFLFFPLYGWGDNLYIVTSINGSCDSALFGTSATGIGDINKDGYDDIFIGAPGVPFAGHVEPESLGGGYIFFGSTDKDTFPDLFLHFTYFNPYFYGYGVGFGKNCISGDLNGDGTTDLVVGAPYTGDYPEEFNGMLYIYLGDTVVVGDTLYPNIMFLGPLYGTLGQAMTIGDINNDGYDDLCMGAPALNTCGFVYIKIGGPGINNYHDIELHGKIINEGFGNSVAVGDLNGDSCEELIIEASGKGDSVLQKIYIYFGKDTIIDTVPNVTLYTQRKNYYSGKGVVYIGDINNDGFGDLVVGTGEWWQDTSYLFLGGTLFDTIPDFIFSGEATTIGDVNNDGKSDMVIWKRLPDTTSLVDIYFGAIGFDTIPEISTIFPYWIRNISNAGDLNGDGYDEILISNAYNNEAGANAGKVWIYTLNQWGVEENSNIKIQALQLSVFPNPFTTSTTIKLNIPNSVGNGRDRSISIFDISGKLIEKTDNPVIGKNLNNGIYFIKVGNSQPVKIIKLSQLK